MSWRWWQQWRERKLDDNDKTKNNNRKRNIIAHSIRRCGGINHANKRRHIDVSIAYIAVLRYEVKWGGKKDIFSSGLMNIELMSSSSSMWQQESQWKTASFTPHTFSTSAMSVCVRGPSAIWGRTCHQHLLPPPLTLLLSCSYTFRRNCQTLVNAQNATDLKSMPTITMSAHASDGASRTKSWCYIAAGKIYIHIYP